MAVHMLKMEVEARNMKDVLARVKAKREEIDLFAFYQESGKVVVELTDAQANADLDAEWEEFAGDLDDDGLIDGFRWEHDY